MREGERKEKKRYEQKEKEKLNEYISVMIKIVRRGFLRRIKRQKNQQITRSIKEMEKK